MMAASKVQAEQWCREVEAFALEAAKKRGIQQSDITLHARVAVNDSVSFNIHKDEK